MARNRKRAKERRARRPQPVPATRAQNDEQAPEPLEHASADVELADAQLAVGSAQLSDEPANAAGPQERAQLEEDLELDAEEVEEQAEEDADSGGAVATRGGAAAEHRAGTGSRLVNFIRGSWRELQRVQWPDRRQVMQATGVVIGFVIIAGAFLGIADFVAGKVMNYVLTGHFK